MTPILSPLEGEIRVNLASPVKGEGFIAPGFLLPQERHVWSGKDMKRAQPTVPLQAEIDELVKKILG